MRNMSPKFQNKNDGDKHTQTKHHTMQKQPGTENLSDDSSEKFNKGKLIEELTDKKEISRAKRQIGNGKLSKVSNVNLIGRDNEEKSKKMDLKKIGSDIRRWMTSEQMKQKIPGCAKFYPFFVKTNNVES